MEAPARMIILDRAHAPDIGHPTYIENQPDLRAKKVWAVVDVICTQKAAWCRTCAGEGSGCWCAEPDWADAWGFDYQAEGLTYAEAEAY